MPCLWIKNNSKTSGPHGLIIYFSDKVNLQRNDRYAALLNTWRIIFGIGYSRLLWVYHQKTWNTDWKLTNKNIDQQHWKQNYV